MEASQHKCKLGLALFKSDINPLMSQGLTRFGFKLYDTIYMVTLFIQFGPKMGLASVIHVEG